MATPSNLVFIDNGNTITVTGNNLPSAGPGAYISSISLPKESYEIVKISTTSGQPYIWLQPLNGAKDIGQIFHANVVTPSTADIDELLEVLIGFFNSATMTTSELVVNINNGTLPAGQWIFVSDFDFARTHRGAWLFCATASTIAPAGFGNCLDCDWTGVGSYTNVETITGIPYTSALGQWSLFKESVYVEITPTAGTIIDGMTLSDQSGWTGVVSSTNGTTFAYVYSTVGDLPTAGDFFDDGGGVTANIDTVAAKASTGYTVAAIDPGNMAAGYRHYQCIDNTLLDGTGPWANTTAYTLIPRDAFWITYTNPSGAFAVGDILDDGTANTWRVLLVNGNSSLVTPMQTVARFPAVGGVLDSGTETADYTGHGSVLVGLGYLPKAREITVGTAYLQAWGLKDERVEFYNQTPDILCQFPWGNTLWSGIKINGGVWLYLNSSPASVSNVTIGAGSVGATKSISDGTISSLNVEDVAQFDVNIGAGFSVVNMTVMKGVAYTGKTVAGTNIGGVISQTDTATETITASPFNNLGKRTATIPITAADIDPGAVFGFLPAVADRYYSDWQLNICYTHVTAPYGGGGPIVVRQGTQVMTQIEPTLLSTASNMVFSGGSGVVANKAQATAIGQALEIDFGGATGGDGTLVMVFTYLLAEHLTA